jgi:hypothetical protein
MKLYVCVFLFGFLLLEKAFQHHIFTLGQVQLFLCVSLVDHELSSPAFALLASEIGCLFRFLDLVHGRGIGEILDLARWDSLLLLHALNSIIHVDVLLDTELL